MPGVVGHGRSSVSGTVLAGARLVVVVVVVLGGVAGLVSLCRRASGAPD